ncbi:MAG: PqqD family protein, partial [Nitrospirales bacterium]
ILDRALGELLRLNEVAGFIWKQLDGSRSAQEIAEGISHRFATDARSAARDVRDFLHQLRSLELVEECEEGEETRK